MISAASTPLLDAALRRAEALERSNLASMAAPDRETASPRSPEVVRAVRREEPGTVTLARLDRLPTAPPGRSRSRAETNRPPGPPVPAEWTGPPTAAAQTLEQGLEDVKRKTLEQVSSYQDRTGARLWPTRVQVVSWLAGEAVRCVDQSRFGPLTVLLADPAGRATREPHAGSAGSLQPAAHTSSEAPFEIRGLRICREVRGFGALEPLETSGLRQGQRILLYCEPSGLCVRTEGDSFVTRFSSRIELVAVRDGTRVWQESLGEAEDRCLSRRRDYYVNYAVSLPASVPAGDYRLRLIQTDMAADRTAVSECSLTIAP